jgi:hypothetical protein
MSGNFLRSAVTDYNKIFIEAGDTQQTFGICKILLDVFHRLNYKATTFRKLDSASASDLDCQSLRLAQSGVLCPLPPFFT